MSDHADGCIWLAHAALAVMSEDELAQLASINTYSRLPEIQAAVEQLLGAEVERRRSVAQRVQQERAQGQRQSSDGSL